MTTLSQILRPEDLVKVQAKFSATVEFNFPIGEVPCEWGPTDGKYNRMASARSDGLFRPTGKLIFDPTDWPRESADLGDELVRETLFHELYHLSQFRRGFIYRLKMKFWNKTLEYGVPPDIKRPHEIEAHKMGHELAQNW